jgi:hypothetical protein
VTQYYCEVWDGAECSKIGLLANRSFGLTRASGDIGSEILDLADIVAGEQKATHCGKVQPFVPCILESGIVKVKAINVDVDDHDRLPRAASTMAFARGNCASPLLLSSLNAETAVTAVSHPATKVTGGVSKKILPDGELNVKEKSYKCAYKHVI